jgi:hypothetical protein
MRAVIFALSLFVFPGSAWAKQPILEVVEQGHHSRVAWTKLVREKDGWRCETEQTKNFYLDREPASLRLFPTGKGSTGHCRDQVHAAKVDAGKVRRWSGCKDDPAARDFFRQLAKDCGRL